MEIGKIAQLLERDRGFIKRTGIEEQLFFHADDLSGMQFAELHEGDKVQFSIVETGKGSYASQISRCAAAK
ncbi:MAG: cold shock domain-containing protein [Patescibacteria group bacterium]